MILPVSPDLMSGAIGWVQRSCIFGTKAREHIRTHLLLAAGRELEVGGSGGTRSVALEHDTALPARKQNRDKYIESKHKRGSIKEYVWPLPLSVPFISVQ